MKSKKLLLSGVISIIALGIVSCDKSEEADVIVPVVKGELASISLQIAGSNSTKASGNPTQEDKVLKLDAFVFNTDGSIEAYKNSTSSSNSVTKVDNIAVTSGDKKVFVLANYAGDASSVRTIADLKSLVADLKNEKDNGQLTMATELVDVTIHPGKNYIGYSSNPSDGTSLAPYTYSLTRLVSRVKVEDMQWQSSEYTFESPTAFVLNAVKNSFLVAAVPPVAPSAYYQSLSGAGDLYPASSTVLSGAENFLTTVASSNSTYFYIYENQPVDNVIYPTILVIRAKVKQNGAYVANIPGRVDASGYTYYPVIINLEGVNSTVSGVTDNHKYVKKNNTYNIKTVVKGLGTSNPFSSDAPSSLNVQVSVANWALNITQTRVFE